MKPKITVNDSGIKAALKEIKLYRDDLIYIEGAGAYILTNGMKQMVPVDSGATKTSIRSHLVEFTDERVVDEIGPETEYAPDIEYGVQSKPNYPVQSFVRPVAIKKLSQVVRSIGYAFSEIILLQWPK